MDDAILLEHPALGVTAMNVAPEFGTVETQAYLKLIEVEERLNGQGLVPTVSKLGEVLREEAVKSGRWKKWMVDGKDQLQAEEIFRDAELTRLITEISGHYTFNNERVKKEIQVLYDNLAQSGIDGEAYVIYKLQNSLDHYVECFNLCGLTTRLQIK